jgi:hypothetical protein
MAAHRAGARQSRDETRRSARWRPGPVYPGTKYGRWCMERPTSPNCWPKCASCGPVTSCCSPTGVATPTSGWPVTAAPSPRSCATPHSAAYWVRALVWRSHLDQFQFSERENRHLGEDIEAAGGKCLLDMRVRPGGSHHQKFVVLRHNGRPEEDVAFVGGIDLCHGRHDDAGHKGDPQAQPMAATHGDRPPWHDLQLAIRGPAAGT